MLTSKKIRSLFVSSCIANLMLACSTFADINGFGNFTGFTVNQNDSKAAPTLTPGKIQITSTSAPQRRSIFYNTRQNISAFNASYTFQSLSTETLGIGFTVQNSTNGLHTVADPTVGSYFGYGNEFNNSVATTIEQSGAVGQASGQYTNGQFSGGATSVAPVTPFNGHPIAVTLSYDGAILTESLFDGTANATYSRFFQVDLPAQVGGQTAYVGFIGGTFGFGTGGNQFISDFQFSSPVTTVLGDYNSDGSVNSQDYILWRKYNGTNKSLPNDATPGSVTPADYTAWRSHFGLAGSGVGTQLSVPEPSAIYLLFMCATLGYLRIPCGRRTSTVLRAERS